MFCVFCVPSALRGVRYTWAGLQTASLAVFVCVRVCACGCEHIHPRDVYRSYTLPSGHPTRVCLCTLHVYGLGAGTCKITQASIAAEALGHSDLGGSKDTVS